MKKLVLIVVATLSINVLSAQIATATVITGITDPNMLLKINQDLIVDAEKIAEDITFVQQLNSTIQYQIKVLQQLSSGSWQGFVDAFNNETLAVNSFNTAVSNQSVTAQVLGAADAAALAQNTSILTNQMNAACNLVNKTNALISQTPTNVNNMQQGVMAIKSAQGDLQALQALGQVLSGVGSEMAAVHETLYANSQYLTTVVQAQAAQEAIDAGAVDSFMKWGNANVSGGAYDAAGKDADVAAANSGNF